METCHGMIMVLVCHYIHSVLVGVLAISERFGKHLGGVLSTCFDPRKRRIALRVRRFEQDGYGHVVSPIRLASVSMFDDLDWVREELRQGAAFDFQFLPPHLKDDRELVSFAIDVGRYGPRAIKHASVRLQDDMELVKAAIKVYDSAYGFASPRLRDSEELFLFFVEHAPMCSLHSCSARLRDDRNLVLALLTSRRKRDEESSFRLYLWEPTLAAVSERLRDDDEVVQNAIALVPTDLQYASDRLRDDLLIVQAAVKGSGRALQYASDRLRNDFSIVQAAR